MKLYQLIPGGLLGLALSANAQILNPGFETAGTGSAAANWTVTQAAGGPVYGVRTNTNPHSGSYHFEAHTASTGAGPVVEFAQSSISVTGGVTYPFTFYSRAVSGSQGYNAQWRVVWNAGGETGFHAFTPGNNTYALISNSIVAPAAATSATLSFYIAGAAIPSQSATLQFDDISFGGAGGGGGVDPQPGTNSLAITLAPAKAIRWFASNSVTYQVQWAATLLGTNTVWNNLGNPVAGNGATNIVYDPVAAPHNFYQVLGIQ
jgi:hypothetical protein